MNKYCDFSSNYDRTNYLLDKFSCNRVNNNELLTAEHRTEVAGTNHTYYVKSKIDVLINLADTSKKIRIDVFEIMSKLNYRVKSLYRNGNLESILSCIILYCIEKEVGDDYDVESNSLWNECNLDKLMYTLVSERLTNNLEDYDNVKKVKYFRTSYDSRNDRYMYYYYVKGNRKYLYSKTLNGLRIKVEDKGLQFKKV